MMSVTNQSDVSLLDTTDGTIETITCSYDNKEVDLNATMTLEMHTDYFTINIGSQQL